MFSISSFVVSSGKVIITDPLTACKIFWSSPQTSVSFSIESEDGRLKLICKNCSSEYYLDTNYYDFIMLSICSKCNNDGFKIYRDTENNNVYLKCSKCGSPPEKIYIDIDGNQVSYETKVLNDVKDLLYKIEQRIYGMEVKIQDLQGSQNILEESLAYINKYLVEKN